MADLIINRAEDWGDHDTCIREPAQPIDRMPEPQPVAATLVRPDGGELTVEVEWFMPFASPAVCHEVWWVLKDVDAVQVPPGTAVHFHGPLR